MHVNLLPHSFAWQRLLVRRFKQWSSVSIVLCVVIAGWNLPLLRKWYTDRDELDLLSQLADPLRKMQVDRIQLAKESLQLDRKLATLHNLLATDRTSSILGIVSQGTSVVADGIQVQDLQLLVSERTSSASANTIQDEASSKGFQIQLLLHGIALDSHSITSFVEHLQNTQLFPSIELRSTQERLISEHSVNEFRLECIAHD